MSPLSAPTVSNVAWWPRCFIDSIVCLKQTLLSVKHRETLPKTALTLISEFLVTRSISVRLLDVALYQQLPVLSGFLVLPLRFPLPEWELKYIATHLGKLLYSGCTPGKWRRWLDIPIIAVRPLLERKGPLSTAPFRVLFGGFQK